MRSSTPGPKFSTSTSHFFINAVRTSLPLGFLVSSVIERLLWFSMVKYRLSTLGTSCSWPRVMSPTPGRSILITSAPNQARSCVQVGPDWTCVKSRMRMPSSALPSLPKGLLDGLGRALPLVFGLTGAFAFSFGAGLREASFTTLREAALLFVRAGFFLAISLSSKLGLFLAKHALRIEVADASALAAGRRVDHRIDEGGLAAIHGLVHGALQLVGCR